MATQAYRSRLDKTVGQNSGTARPVHPAQPELNVKPGMENRTPSPTRTYDPTAKDHTFGRANGNPGTNAYDGASSIAPGQKSAPAAINPQAPVDTVLAGLIQGRTAKLDAEDDWQTRQIDATPMPTSFGQRSRTAESSEAVVPAKTGASSAKPPVRQP